MLLLFGCFFFSSRRRHTRFDCDWSSDVCSSDLHITFDIHRALVQTIDFGDPGGQRLQMPLLEGKQLARNGADVFFIGGVDPLAPLPSLPIQVWPTGEGAAGQEVPLDRKSVV